MRKILTIVLFLSVCLSVFSSDVHKNRRQPSQYWIFFTDKGEITEEKMSEAKSKLSEKNISRRLKVKDYSSLITFEDLPLCEIYVDYVQSLGLNVRTKSRWLNAVTVRIDDESLFDILKGQGFVKDVRPVLGGISREDATGGEFLTPKATSERMSFDYGDSERQLEMLNIPKLHRTGLDGTGVRVCIMDTGFRTTHSAFSTANIIGWYDFISDDSTVSYEPGDPSTTENHGTTCFSALGGRAEGILYGPAFGAEFLLARTEDVSGETMIEEEYWVAGAEWAESNDADIISSSLGYRTGILRLT
jgi:subtilisin family serine protease